jgi:phosphopantetheinyl transferase
MPLLHHNKSPLFGIWEITEPWQEMAGSLQNKDFYEADLIKIQPEKRKQEWVAVRLLLQHLTFARTYIIYGENGAPGLSDDTYKISISHTKGFAAIILSENSQPGIDIEFRSERAWKLREKFLNKHELEILTMLNECEKNIDLATVCWCAKEAAFKALGKSAVDFAGHFTIEPFNLSTEGILFLQESRTPQKQRFPIRYQINEAYILTWIA